MTPPFALLTLATFLLVALPWLNPFAAGPSPAVFPLLFAWGCAAALWAFWGGWVALGGPLKANPLVKPVAWAWLVVGLISSGLGLLQFFGAAGALEPWANQSALGEAFANLRQRNQFATLTNIALAALLWVAGSVPIAPKHVQSKRWLTLQCLPALMLLMAAGLLGLGNAASSSRTGLVQMLLLVGLCGPWGLWSKASTGACARLWAAPKRLLMVALTAYVLGLILLPYLAGFDWQALGLFARLRAGDELCVSRTTLWANVLHLISLKPWLGWGWGELDFAHYNTLYSGPRFCDILDNAHNLPLQLAVELGVPVAVLVCGGFALWALRQRPWAEAQPARQLAWGVVAVILLHSLLEYPLWYGPFQMALVLCLGYLHASRVPKGALNPILSKNNARAGVLHACVATFLIVCVVYASHDYRRISQIYLPPETRDDALKEDTLTKLHGSWLFASQVQFAELMLTPLTPANAQWTFDTATSQLHYSPEPRVIEKTIESAVMLGRDDVALQHLARYKAAFAADHARWALNNRKTITGP